MDTQHSIISFPPTGSGGSDLPQSLTALQAVAWAMTRNPRIVALAGAEPASPEEAEELDLPECRRVTLGWLDHRAVTEQSNDQVTEVEQQRSALKDRATAAKLAWLEHETRPEWMNDQQQIDWLDANFFRLAHAAAAAETKEQADRRYASTRAEVEFALWNAEASPEGRTAARFRELTKALGDLARQSRELETTFDVGHTDRAITKLVEACREGRVLSKTRNVDAETYATEAADWWLGRTLEVNGKGNLVLHLEHDGKSWPAKAHWQPLFDRDSVRKEWPAQGEVNAVESGQAPMPTPAAPPLSLEDKEALYEEFARSIPGGPNREQNNTWADENDVARKVADGWRDKSTTKDMSGRRRGPKPK